MTLPIPEEYFKQVTQSFGIPNSYYKSGIHMGTDFRCPIGTPIVAPCDGEIIHRWINHLSLGNAIHFSCLDGTYIRFLHMSSMKLRGAYKEGEIIGYTGNTGASTGAHLHVDVWTCPINTSLIKTKEGVHKWLLDPVPFFERVVS